MKLISVLFLSLFMLGSCAREEFVENPAEGGRGNVHFRLGGAANAIGTRASAEDLKGTENERHIESVLALLWDIEEGFYKTIEAIPSSTTGEYDIDVDRDGEYFIFFVANADSETKDMLMNLEKGVGKNYDNYARANQIRNAVSKQAPDAEYFLMTSSTSGKRMNVSITSKCDLGTIEMVRPASRFDIINMADDIKVTKITYNNRAVKTHMMTPSVWNTNDDSEWYDNAVYYPEDLVGNSDITKAGTYKHEIYSYRNSSIDKATEKVPSLTIEYEEAVDGKTVKKEHTVEFIDPTSENGAPLKISVNRLYTITLRKATNLEFDVNVSDWEETDGFVASDLGISDLDIPSEQQQAMNARLKVNMFAGTDVKSLNLTTKTAELFPEMSLDLNDYSTSADGAYFSYNQLKNAGLTSSDPTLNKIIGSDGVAYRLPTAGEMALICPLNRRAVEDIELPQGTNINTGNSSNMNIDLFMCISGQLTNLNLNLDCSIIDYALFKNNDDGTPIIPTNDVDESEGISSICQWILGKTLTYRYCKTPGGFKLGSGDTDCWTYAPVYAVRFKGTAQYAAYKYEYCDNGDPTKAYGSVKIKALPENLDVNVYMVADNDDFWSKDYIEFKFPAIGMINSGTTKTNLTWCQRMTTSIASQGQYKGRALTGGLARNVAWLSYCESNDRKFPLRLVKAESQPAPSGSKRR